MSCVLAILLNYFYYIIQCSSCYYYYYCSSSFLLLVLSIAAVALCSLVVRLYATGRWKTSDDIVRLISLYCCSKGFVEIAISRMGRRELDVVANAPAAMRRLGYYSGALEKNSTKPPIPTHANLETISLYCLFLVSFLYFWLAAYAFRQVYHMICKRNKDNTTVEKVSRQRYLATQAATSFHAIVRLF